MRALLLSATLVTSLTACGDSGSSPPDAPATPDAPADALPPFDCETSPTSGKHKVFLQFEGVTLTHATLSDATQDRWSVLDEGTTHTVPAWRADDPDREALRQAVVCAVRETFYPFDVEIVTTRPASGSYEMVVIGGRGTDIGIDLSPSTVLNALATTPCAAGVNAREVGWVAEFPSTGPHQLEAIETATMVAYTLGINSLLSYSKSRTNCMCHPIFGSPCDTTRLCEFTQSSMIPPEAPLCGRLEIVENQIEKLRARYGARM